MKHQDSKWLRNVNSLFLLYLARRRITEELKCDVNIEERRAECLRLATFFEQLERENDPEATLEQLKIRFDRTMERIKDFVPTGEGA